MKFNVYIKSLAAFFLIMLAFILAFFKYMKSVEIEIAVNSQKTITFGLLTSLEHELVNLPEASWHTILNKKENANIHLMPIEKLTVPPNQIKQLDDGQTVFVIGRELQFLNEVFARKTAYKKVGNLPYALAYDFSEPEQIISYYMTPGLQQIVNTLLSKPQKTWAQELENLKKAYGYPLQLYKRNSRDIPSHILTTLKSKPLAFETKKNSSQIDIIYYPFHGGILKVGSLKYLFFTTRITDVIYYFVLSFFLLGFFLVLFISLLFVRNMKRIYQITEKFSQGVFTYHHKISSTSVLYGLYSNIIQMGGRLKKLIDSHKQISRFVAHEIRTPLYTMQLALDSMEKSISNKRDPEKHIDSLREDINDLNQLVSYFLIYSQTTSNELKIKKKSLDMKQWISDIVSNHQSYNLKVNLELPDNEKYNLSFDPDLLKLAVNNLISNALKFAETQVRITLEIKKDVTMIHIDDDGPGIEDENKKIIFQAFVTLESEASFGKHIGLGLMITKSIIELHGGRISVEDSPILSGARFSFFLPKS